MMTGTHPEDFDLFDYVEGKLPDSRRAEVQAHLASCARCAEQLALVQAGRDAVRRSQPLELPRRRRDAILRNLPAQPKERRSWGISLKHVLAALTPVAVAGLVVLALVNVDGNDNEEGAAAGGGDTAELSAPTEESAAGDGQTLDRKNKNGRMLFGVGSPGAVAADLRREGFAATAVGDHVEVRDATRAEVRRALQSRREDGSVRIVIVP